MSKRQRIAIAIPFFALMLGYLGLRIYLGAVAPMQYSRRGWNAELREGRTVVTSVGESSTATGLINEGDEIVAFWSDRPDAMSVTTPSYWRIPPGTHYKLTIRHSGRLQELSLQTTRIRTEGPMGVYLALFWLTFLLFLVTGAAVFLLRPDDKQAWLLFLMLTSLVALFPLSIYLPLPRALSFFTHFTQVLSILFVPVFLHFFLIFPERSPLLRRVPQLERLLYLPYLLILLPLFTIKSLVFVFLFAPSWRGGFETRADQVITGLAVLYMAAGLVSMVINYRVATPGARRKLRVVMTGSGAGFFNLLLMPFGEVVGLSQAFPTLWHLLDFALLFTLPLVPLSFAYAIVKHQVIPISLIIRRGVRYVLVSRGSVLLEGIAVCLSVTALLTYVFSRMKPSGLVVGIVSAAVGIVTWKLANRLHDKYLAPVIDRRFFRESYNLHQILADLTQELRTVSGLPHLLELVSTKIQSALKTENVTIFLRDQQTGDYLSGYSCDYQTGHQEPVASDQLFRIPHYASIIEKLSDAGSPIEIEDGVSFSSRSNGNAPAGAECETLQRVKSTLLLPLTTKEGLGGMISLGPRLGDLPYSRDDKQLLMSVAGPTTFAIENAQLVERMLEDARHRQELEAENELRARELEDARQLQLSMLPKIVPQLPHVEIAAYMKTATEVGGDYYDFHLADDGTLTIAVGDATGHGLKAGTVVTAAKSLFNNLAHSADITDIFQQSSRTLKGMNLRSLFMAMTILRISANRMTVSVAGMPPVLIHRAKTGTIEEAALKGLPLGSMRNYQWRQQDFDLLPGDVVVAMSDGFPELFNGEGEMFGYEQASAALVDVAACTPVQIVEHFVRVAVQWADGRPQDDDVTFVVLKINDSIEVS